MIKLYEVTLSGNCHKARMLLSMLGMPYESVGVNLAVGEQRAPQFLAISPFGQVPVLVDDHVAVRDSQAILVYLASRYGGEQWWPQDPMLLARIAGWLSTAANEIAASLAILRAHHKWNRPIDVAQAQALANKTLPVIDAELTKGQWLVGNSLSIADLAIYPYVALAPEGQINLQSYTAILRWISDVQALPGYVGMPGMWGNAS